MSEFNIRSESVDVEQIMEQIRSRIRDKRGADYTEAQIRDMAGVKLERFLDPQNVRSDLLAHYRKRGDDPVEPLTHPEAPPEPPSFEFDEDTIYRSSRGFAGRALHALRRLLNPLLKFFFNPTPIVHALTIQRQINEQQIAQINWMVQTNVELIQRFERIAAKLSARAELDALTYELLNNLVVEMTRLSIDVKNHKMRVESIAGRLDFDERRARALEDVVQYRAPAESGAAAAAADVDSSGDAAGPEKRRRRRRRGRRRSGTGVATDVATGDSAGSEPGAAQTATPPETTGTAPEPVAPDDGSAPPEPVAPDVGTPPPELVAPDVGTAPPEPIAPDVGSPPPELVAPDVGTAPPEPIAPDVGTAPPEPIAPDVGTPPPEPIAPDVGSPPSQPVALDVEAESAIAAPTAVAPASHDSAGEAESAPEAARRPPGTPDGSPDQ